VDESADELVLAELQREIDGETEAIADLDRRTRVLEAEVAGWGSRPPPRPVQRWTRFERFLSLLGFFMTFFPTAVIFGLIAFALRPAP
jgi:hypothetical protein